MKCEVFVNKVFEQNTYLLIDEKKCVIIDPGGNEPNGILEYIQEYNLDLVGILITHGHFDHILNLEYILNYKNVPIYIGKEDKKFLFDYKYNLSGFIDIEYKLQDKYIINEINDGDIVFNLECINTSGHTKGSICYYNKKDKMIFTGDTLFKMAYGRVDFPTGNMDEMRQSLHKLLSMDKDIVVYPGHGDKTTIGDEYTTYYGYY